MGTYSVLELRAYDRDALRRASRVANRYLERVPRCWMCATTTERRTKEHIFAQSLVREFPDNGGRWSPTKFNPAWATTAPLQPTHAYGPMSSGQLVAGGVCARCNNGWMSDLEAKLKPLLVSPPERLDKYEDVEALARWFCKTAIVINASMPYRLLWERERRHQVSSRVPDNVSVALFKVPTSDLNWLQGDVGSVSTFDSRLDFDEVQTHLEMTHICRIQVGNLVGVVASYPWQLASSDIEVDASWLWDRGVGYSVDVSGLPEHKDIWEAHPMFHVMDGAFWSPIAGEPAGYLRNEAPHDRLQSLRRRRQASPASR